MSTEEKQLLKLNGLFFFTIYLASIFVNLFLFQLGEFRAVVYYGLVSLITLFILYLFSGYLLYKISSQILIRVGLLLLSILYLLLLIFRENSINYLFFLGMISGLGHGCFWVGNNLTAYIATHEHSRNEYFGKLNFFHEYRLIFWPCFRRFNNLFLWYLFS